MKHILPILLLAAASAIAQEPVKPSNLPAITGAEIDLATDGVPMSDMSVPASKFATWLEIWKAFGGTNVSAAELGYLDGTTGPIQTQLNAKIGPDGVTNAAVAAAIAADPEPILEEIGLVDDGGTIPESFFGSYSRNLLLSPDGSVWSVSVANNGALATELLVGSELMAYQAATGITLEAAAELQTMFTALDDAGVLGNLVDGSILKSRYATVDGDTIRSLRGTAPIRLKGSTALGDCGLLFPGNSLTTGAKAVFPDPVGARTFVSLMQFGQNFQTPFTNDFAVPYQLTANYPNGLRGDSFDFSSGSTNGNFRFATSVENDARTLTSSFSRAFPPKSYMFAQAFANLPKNTADAIRAKVRGSTVQQATTNAPYDVISLLFNGRAEPHNASATGFATNLPCDMAAGAWLLFDKYFSETEMGAVMAALDLVCPRWKYVAGGSSLMNFRSAYFFDLPEVFGANVVVTKKATGGSTIAADVAALGTTGIVASNFQSGEPLIIFDYHNIDLFTGSSAAAQHADLRTLWQYAKTANPDTVVIGRTITPTATLEAEGTMAELLALNDLIRADEGVHYDILVDSYAIGESLKNPAVTYQHNDPVVCVDGVHPTKLFAEADMRVLISKLEAAGHKIR